VDRVFVRPAVRIVRAETVTGRECGVWPSDHFPVLADLDLTKDDLA
jgi:endonuclease/exonuclease/phosphatase family metal-dependent hydrolase